MLFCWLVLEQKYIQTNILPRIQTEAILEIRKWR